MFPSKQPLDRASEAPVPGQTQLNQTYPQHLVAPTNVAPAASLFQAQNVNVPSLLPTTNQAQTAHNETQYYQNSPLTRWLNKQCFLPERLCVPAVSIDFDQAFIALDYVYPLHRAPEINELGRGLVTAWNETNNYINKAVANLDGDTSRVYRNTLDSEERFRILETCGQPPKPCYSIYMVSVGRGEQERLVYVGMTGKDSHRFKNGHKVAYSLHKPEYDGLEKNIYIGTITLLSKEHKYLPITHIQYTIYTLQWFRQIDLNIYSDSEKQFIYHVLSLLLQVEHYQAFSTEWWDDFKQGLAFLKRGLVIPEAWRIQLNDEIRKLDTILRMRRPQFEYLPIEWVQELKHGLDLLDSIESQLIYILQPEVNEKKKANYCAKYTFESIQIQNFTGQPNQPSFMNNKFIGSPQLNRGYQLPVLR